MDPNERHESLTEILDVHDIADALVPAPWTLACRAHVHFMEPTAHMHNDADGALLNERVEAVDCGVPIRVVEFHGCLHLLATCNDSHLPLGCHGEMLQMRLNDR